MEGPRELARSYILVAALLLSPAAALAQAADAGALRERVREQEERLEEQREQIEEQQRELDEVKAAIEAMGEGPPDADEAEASPDASTAPDPVAYWPGLGKPLLAFKVPVLEPSGSYQVSIGAHLNRAVNTAADGNRTKATS